MLVASLCLSTFICYCTFRQSSRDESSNVQWIPLEDLEPSEQLSSWLEPLPLAGDPQGHADEPLPSPNILQFHREQEESPEHEETPGPPLVHRNVPRRAGQPGSETEPSSAEQ